MLSSLNKLKKYKCRFFPDLRMKLEPMVQDEPPSSTASGNGISSPSNGPLGNIPGYENERDKNDLIQNTLWSTKHKSSSISTPDGMYIFRQNILT